MIVHNFPVPKPLHPLVQALMNQLKVLHDAGTPADEVMLSPTLYDRFLREGLQVTPNGGDFTLSTIYGDVKIEAIKLLELITPDVPVFYMHAKRVYP